MKSYNEALHEATEQLREAGVPEAELNAWYLLEEAVRHPSPPSEAGAEEPPEAGTKEEPADGISGFNRAFFLLHGEEPIGEPARLRLQALTAYRSKRVPLEYITHHTEFMGMPFFVDGRVLIPRQDTECLVEEALKYSEGSDVLDLCTGSGCIAIAIAGLGKPKSVTAADKSAPALEVAKKNAGINRVSVTLIHSDLWESIPGDYDLITCNPPYIARDVIPTLMPEVKEYEPVMALEGGEDGLFFYRSIMKEIGAFLRKNGRLIVEIGYDQGEAVSELMRRAGLADVRVIKDLAGLDRIVTGRRIRRI